MIVIPTTQQTLQTFWIYDSDGTKYEFYKNISDNYAYALKLLCGLLNLTKSDFDKSKLTEYELEDFNKKILNMGKGCKDITNLELKLITPIVLQKYIKFNRYVMRKQLDPNPRPEYQNKWNYLIHSSQYHNFKGILKDGKIKPFSLNAKWAEGYAEDELPPDVHKVFTNYIFSDLEYSGRDWDYYSNHSYVIYVIDMDILKTQKYFCSNLQFGAGTRTPSSIIMHGPDYNLNLLKNYINDRLDAYRRMKHQEPPKSEYVYKHEILLKEVQFKFIKAIVCHSDVLEFVKNSISLAGYSIPTYRYTSNYKKLFDKIHLDKGRVHTHY